MCITVGAKYKCMECYEIVMYLSLGCSVHFILFTNDIVVFDEIIAMVAAEGGRSC